MRKILITFILIGIMCFSFKAYSQCKIIELFPPQYGMTKFQSINALNIQGNVYEIEALSNYWDHPEYLNGDSIYCSQVNYKIRTHNCVKSSNNEVQLNFADYKLYKMILRIWFEPEDLNKCLENYNLIFESQKLEFPICSEIVISNSETEEQIGEGYWLYKSNAEKHNDKFEQVFISYNIEYEMKWSKYKKMHETGNIDRYLLQIGYVNLKGTKLDKRGY